MILTLYAEQSSGTWNASVDAVAAVVVANSNFVDTKSALTPVIVSFETAEILDISFELVVIVASSALWVIAEWFWKEFVTDNKCDGFPCSAPIVVIVVISDEKFESVTLTGVCDDDVKSDKLALALKICAGDVTVLSTLLSAMLLSLFADESIENEFEWEIAIKSAATPKVTLHNIIWYSDWNNFFWPTTKNFQLKWILFFECSQLSHTKNFRIPSKFIKKVS